MPHTDLSRPQPSAPALIFFGALTGVLSGLFGIGGGVVLVPLLVLFLGFQQRLAAGTSVAAILPAAVIGGISYGVQGNVDWLAALLLAVGVVAGAQIGSALLSRVPTGVLQWIFMVFLLGVIISLWFVVPQRDASIDIDLITGALLVALGLATGILSGLLGVGGGVVVVPALMFFFGASDLVAKGTSLIMLIPGSLSGTLGNLKRGNVDLRSALLLGVTAGLLSPAGTFIAAYISPLWSNIAFSVLLTYVLGQMVFKALRTKR